MSTIAIDATYTVDPEPTGIANYSRKLIEALATLETPHRFLVCYRLSRFRQRRRFLRPLRSGRPNRPTFSVRLVQEYLTFWLPWQAELFHSLAQRPPAFRFPKEIVTIIDLFPITGRDYSTPDFQQNFSALLLQAAERATLIITASEYTTQQLLKHSNVRKEKIRLIPFGVELPHHQLWPEERAAERERLVGKGNAMLLGVGAIQNRKNNLNALRALQIMPANYQLVLAGGDGYGSEAVHEFIRKERLESRVTVLGYVGVEQLAGLYQMASALLFPSLEEGFGFPVLEAMANEIPVVTSNTSSLPEVGGDAALYVNPHDPHDIAEKTQRAVEDSDLRARLIERGRARSREFTWRRTAEQTLAVYDEALAM